MVSQYDYLQNISYIGATLEQVDKHINKIWPQTSHVFQRACTWHLRTRFLSLNYQSYTYVILNQNIQIMKGTQTSQVSLTQMQYQTQYINLDAVHQIFKNNGSVKLSTVQTENIKLKNKQVITCRRKFIHSFPLPVMWKDQFNQSLRKYLQIDHHVHSESDTQTYLNLSQVKSKHGMWNKVAILCGATEKQVHDYYHNTWSKQFCDSYEEYKDQFNEQLLNLMQSNMRKSDVLNQLIEHRYSQRNTRHSKQILHDKTEAITIHNQIER
ncbi:Conserved_hypothetical protein [Hexamita inflata]|uniref:SANT domain-containing protein n=1 Tax=Hexamita inflata TaxID=28002 RepID=A0ABP1MSH9_9EUKA